MRLKRVAKVGMTTWFAVLTVAVAVAAEPFGLAVKAYERGEYAVALRSFRRLAGEDNPGAAYYLGEMFRYGRGVRQDDAKAVVWYRRAAKQGHALAQRKMGSAYFLGHLDLPKDPVEGARWYRRAAEGGDLYAQHALAAIYFQGAPGISRDYASSAYWYRRAADRGDAFAQLALGAIYAQGYPGVRRDVVKAHVWFSLAASQGLKAGARQRDRIAASMTKEQIEEARIRMRNWRKSRD